jgi:hypothetical protein
MAKSRTPQGAAVRPDPLSGWKWMGVAAFVLLLFYFTPLLSPNATIQWDAVDLHYPSQRYFADHVRDGVWPFWTPFIFCGFPFLADPQVGAFYPLNWPFFWWGITPGAIQGELALHSLLALVGGFLLLRRLTGHPAGSLAGALTYALGGFFAAHSSHVGIFQGAALLPWLLYTFERGLRGSAMRWFAASGGVAGCIFLAGHLMTGAHALLGLALYAAWRIASEPRLFVRALAGLVGIAMVAVGLAGVAVAPWTELRTQSAAVGVAAAGADDQLNPGALATLIYPNALGTLSGKNPPAGDVTYAYLYSGILLLPLGALALKRRQGMVAGGLLVAIPVVAVLATAQGSLWFVAAMGLAILAAFGIGEAEQRWKKPWLGLALLAVCAVDLCQFNSWSNPLTYGRASYEEMYGVGEAALRFKVGPEVKPPFRLHLPDRLPIFGPLNSPLTIRVETTGGSNPLELAAWREYKEAAKVNHRLIDGVAAAIEVKAREEQVSANPAVMPRAFFAPVLVGVKSLGESKARLERLDPREQSVVLNLPPGIQQDPQAKAESMKVTEGRVSIRYTAATPSLLRLADAWYPGWHATVEGRPLEVLRVNHALMGAVAPAGSHEVVFEYRPRLFQQGAWISLASLGLLLGAVGLSFVGKQRQGADNDGIGA